MKNTKSQNEYLKRYYFKNKEKILKYGITRRNKIKEECFLHYGNGKISCACCGETEIKFLTLDHSNGGGNKHRVSLGMGKRGGQEMYFWTIKNKFPPIFQILCMNCNGGKERNNGVCPHKLNINNK